MYTMGGAITFGPSKDKESSTVPEEKNRNVEIDGDWKRCNGVAAAANAVEFFTEAEVSAKRARRTVVEDPGKARRDNFIKASLDDIVFLLAYLEKL